MIKQYSHCQIHINVQKAEPLFPCSLPDRSWQRIDIDMLTHQHQTYMAVSDEYSRWLEMNMKTTCAVISEIKKIFVNLGISRCY